MTVRSNIVAQFKKPDGALGSLVGWVMANRNSNRERNHWTVSLLDIQKEDDVLEIGFGPGLGIKFVSEFTVDGFVAGIDHSQVMVDQATKRNQFAVDQGRVELKLGSVENFPDFSRQFDKIFSANVCQFWPDRTRSYRELRSMLKPNGVIATTFMPRNRGASNSDSDRMKKKILHDMNVAGFRNIKVETLPMKPANVICVLGQNSDVDN
ncbi:MAG: class I SAM-dependent methyltransferase [Proteobacteria bacterium]|nr:class I SAM-dependent methyltransferase [Pseudomonadota bacterium]